MTSDKTWKFLMHSDATLNAIGRLLFITKAIENQIAAIELLNDLHAKAEIVLQKSQSRNFSDLSNRTRGLICVICAVKAELQMYVCIKQDKMDDAWDRLIDAQDLIENARAAHAVFLDGLKQSADRLDDMERLLFQKQIFFSHGSTVYQADCSICESDIKHCDHITGQIYNGNFCHQIIKKFRINEISVVERPADKRCRAIHYSEDDKCYNVITGRIAALA